MSKALDDLLYGGINVYTKEYGNCIAYTQDCIDIIEKELQQKEELEKENKRLANALKKKKGKLRHYATIKKENKELKANIDSEVNFLTNELFEEQKINIDLVNKYTKLKKVIEDIKNLPNCDICDANWHKGCMCLKKKIDEVLENE